MFLASCAYAQGLNERQEAFYKCEKAHYAKMAKAYEAEADGGKEKLLLDLCAYGGVTDERTCMYAVTLAQMEGKLLPAINAFAFAQAQEKCGEFPKYENKKSKDK